MIIASTLAYFGLQGSDPGYLTDGMIFFALDCQLILIAVDVLERSMKLRIGYDDEEQLLTTEDEDEEVKDHDITVTTPSTRQADRKKKLERIYRLQRIEQIKATLDQLTARDTIVDQERLTHENDFQQNDTAPDTIQVVVDPPFNRRKAIVGIECDTMHEFCADCSLFQVCMIYINPSIAT